MTTCSTGPCWTASTFNGTNFDTQSATTFNNLWIVGGQNSSNGNSDVQYSSDGTNWTRVSLSGTGGGGVKSFASGNGIIMGMVNFDKHILSSDGINWTVVAHWPPVSGEAGLTFGAGYFVFTFNSVDAVCYSPTGQAGTWSVTYSAPFTFGYMNGSRIYGGGLFVTTGSDGFSYSPSPTTPVTPVPYPVAGVRSEALAYGSGAYVATTRSRSVYRSTDGINWTLLVDVLPSTPDGINQQWITIIYSQGYFMCCKLDSKYLAISPDGITWTLTSGDSEFDSPPNSGYNVLGTDENGQYIAVKPLSSVSQVGVCPCPTPIDYGNWWASLTNVIVKNIVITRIAGPTPPPPPVDPYYDDVVLLSNMSSGSGGSVITDNMILYVNATNGLTPVIGNTTLIGNAPVVDNYFDFNGFAAINIENPNLYNVSWASGKTILVAAQFNSGFNEPGYRALLGATGEFGLLDRIVNLYLEVLNPPPYSEAKYRLAFSAGSYGTWSADLNIAPNSWFIFGVTHSPDGTVKFYVNGYQVPNLDPGATQPLTGFNPGSQYLGRADNYWWGKIGYWQVYNTALTSQQVLQNYRATTNNFPGGNTLMIDESKYSNPSKIYYAGWEEFQSYLVNTGGPINNGACWKCAYSDTTGFANRIVYYDSIPQFAMPGDFTIEAWIYNAVYSLGEAQYCLTGSTGIDQTVWSINTSSSSGFVFISNQLKDASNPSADLVISNPASAGQWHHVAVVRSGNTVKIYVDGTQSASQASKNVVPGGSIPECKITALGQMQGGALPNTWMQTGDYLGPFRITVGVARYTGPFTPPTDYFPTQ